MMIFCSHEVRVITYKCTSDTNIDELIGIQLWIVVAAAEVHNIETSLHDAVI